MLKDMFQLSHLRRAFASNLTPSLMGLQIMRLVLSLLTGLFHALSLLCTRAHTHTLTHTSKG